jgi:recombination associated protein RdgC
MGILSSAVSITRYRAEGKIEGSVMETIAKGLKKNAILEIPVLFLETSLSSR